MDKLTASEAVYGFAGWLTSRDATTVMSATNNCACIADLVNQFCEANQLDEPRPGWHHNLTHPKESE